MKIRLFQHPVAAIPLVVAISSALILGETAWGQQVSIQQPVIQQFGVSTTVMVPVGGYAYIGGNRSALDSSSRYGFGRFGSSRGYQRSSSSMWSSVRVFDLRSLDEAILNSYARETSRIDPSWHARLESMPRPLGEFDGRFTRRDPNALPQRPPEEPAPVSPVKTIEAEQFEEWARDAEARGKMALARSYWEAAAKKGSATAQARVAELDRKVLSIGRPATAIVPVPSSSKSILVEGVPPAPLPPAPLPQSPSGVK